MDPMTGRRMTHCALCMVAAVLLTTRTTSQDTRPGVESAPTAGDLLSFANPEAVDLWSSTDTVGIVTSCGAVHFIDVKTGSCVRSVATGIAGWRRQAEGRLGDWRIPVELTGIPLAVSGQRIFGVDDRGRLVSIDENGRRTLVVQHGSLEGATVVCPTDEDAVFVGTRSGRMLTVLEDRLLVGDTPLGEPVLVIAAPRTGAWCLSAGIGPSWDVRDGLTLRLMSRTGNHIGEEFIHALVVSDDSRQIAVAHGFTTCRIKTFSVCPAGEVTGFGAFKKGGAVSTTLAYDRSMRLIVVGDESGALRVIPSGLGDQENLPRSPLREGAEGGGHGKRRRAHDRQVAARPGTGVVARG